MLGLCRSLLTALRDALAGQICIAFLNGFHHIAHIAVQLNDDILGTLRDSCCCHEINLSRASWQEWVVIANHDLAVCRFCFCKLSLCSDNAILEMENLPARPNFLNELRRHSARARQPEEVRLPEYSLGGALEKGKIAGPPIDV